MDWIVVVEVAGNACVGIYFARLILMIDWRHRVWEGEGTRKTEWMVGAHWEELGQPLAIKT